MSTDAGTRTIYDVVLFWTGNGPDVRIKKNIFLVDSDGELKKNSVMISTYEIEKGKTVDVEVAVSAPIVSEEVGRFNSIEAALARKHELESGKK